MATQTKTPAKTQAASVVYQWPSQGEWAYEDYARLPDDGRRYEVIGGNLHVSPAPLTRHQVVVTELAYALMTFTKTEKVGQILVSPIDVILPDLANPVQPDILFIANERLGIVKEQFVAGVPDLIVEVLSPGNPAHDRRTKYALYEGAGVKEYWIVDPEACIVDVYTLYGGDLYVPHGHFAPGGVIQSKLLSDLRISVDDICQP